MNRKEAQRFITALRTLRDGATDAQASTAVDLYPTMKYNETLIKAGTRINWNGAIKRAATDLWDTAENNPDNAPALWEDIEYRDGYRIIPATITVGKMFALGECGWWGDDLYESLKDANVHTPEQYPAGWRLIAQ